LERREPHIDELILAYAAIHSTVPCLQCRTGGIRRMRTFATAITFILASILGAPLVHAQTTHPSTVPHAASPTAIAQALQEWTANTDAQRERVRQLLQRADVQKLAGDLGIDLRRAESAVGTLEGQQLADVSAQADRLASALAGGASNVTISTTTIIIALL